MNYRRDCKPEPKARGINRWSDGEFAGRRGEETRPGGIARFQAGAECSLGLGETLAAAGADAKVPREIAQRIRTVFDSGPDVPLGDCFAYTNYHGAIVNANANDCQYHSLCET